MNPPFVLLEDVGNGPLPAISVFDAIIDFERVVGGEQKFHIPVSPLIDGGDVGPHEMGGVLIDRPLAPRLVSVLEVSERRGRRDRVRFVVAVVVKGDVEEGVVGTS